jgi:hypothetical protein
MSLRQRRPKGSISLAEIGQTHQSQIVGALSQGLDEASIDGMPLGRSGPGDQDLGELHRSPGAALSAGALFPNVSNARNVAVDGIGTGMAGSSDVFELLVELEVSITKESAH